MELQKKQENRFDRTYAAPPKVSDGDRQTLNWNPRSQRRRERPKIPRNRTVEGEDAGVVGKP